MFFAVFSSKNPLYSENNCGEDQFSEGMSLKTQHYYYFFIIIFLQVSCKVVVVKTYKSIILHSLLINTSEAGARANAQHCPRSICWYEDPGSKAAHFPAGEGEGRCAHCRRGSAGV